MNKTQHTPGPWTVTTWHATQHAEINNSENKSIADVWGIDITADEMTANAALIAAAPELLTALENVLDCENYEYHEPNYDDIRAAIAKAKGEPTP